MKGCQEKQGKKLFAFLFLFIQNFLLLGGLFFLFFVGDDVETNGVDLHHLEFDLALRAAQNLALFDFVFVHVNLGDAFRTPDHGENLLTKGSNSI